MNYWSVSVRFLCVVVDSNISSVALLVGSSDSPSVKVT